MDLISIVDFWLFFFLSAIFLSMCFRRLKQTIKKKKKEEMMNVEMVMGGFVFFVHALS